MDVNQMLDTVGRKLADVAGLVYGKEFVLHRLPPGKNNTLALFVNGTVPGSMVSPRYEVQLLGYFESPQAALTALANIEKVLPMFDSEISLIRRSSAMYETSNSGKNVTAVSINMQLRNQTNQ